MERNYKSSLTYTEAISELKLVAGKQLDAEIVEYFCHVPLRKIEESLGSVKKKMQFYQYENSYYAGDGHVFSGNKCISTGK